MAVSENQSGIAEYHRNFWAGDYAKAYHDQNRHQFQEMFLDDFLGVVDELETVLEQNRSITTICEIGTGSGQLLDYLSNRLPTIKRFIGIDLSDATIRDNRERYPNDSIDWIAADAIEWIEQNAGPAWVFVSHRGVMEYFTQSQVESLFRFIAEKKSPAVLLVIEPVGLDHDLENQFESQPYGIEYSLSHNYPHLLRSAGFEVRHLKSKEYFSYELHAYLAKAEL